MKEIIVPAIYIVTDRIKSHSENKRLENMLAKIKSSKITKITDTDYKEFIKQNDWYKKSRTGETRKGNPVVVFSGFDWNDKINNISTLKSRKAFAAGSFSFADFRDKSQLLSEKGVACNSGYEIHSAFGCFHACDYCHIGDVYTIMLNLEESAAKVGKLMELNPWQRLWKYDNQTDLMTLEPEYGASKMFVELFSNTDNYLMLYTKSNNVEHLLDINHNGKTVVCFTISSEYTSTHFEKNTPSLYERVEAAEKCQDAGYPVRIRFSPIIPINGWKEETSGMIERTFRNLNPDVVSIEMLCHMDIDTLNSSLDTSNFDPSFLNEIKGSEYELFSHEKRREVYSHFIKEIRKMNKDVKIALCLETPKIWASFKDSLNGTSYNFKCCCGAKSTPN